MSRPLLTALILTLAGPAAIAAPPAAAAAPTLAYARDAAEWLKGHHRVALRRPGNQVRRKFAAMSETAIGFFRGAAPLYYRDLTEHPQLRARIAIPLMGDMHIENLGAWRTPTGAFAYDLNDFDEAFTGPYTWELARAAVSVRLHAAAARLDDAAQDRLVARFLGAWTQRLAGFAKEPRTIARPITAELASPPVKAAIATAARYDERAFLARWAAGGKLRPSKHVVPLDPATANGLALALDSYVRGRKEPAGFFKLKDAATRVAGLASLSRQRFLLLVEGPSAAEGDDLLLELKEQGPPAASPWVPAPAGSQAQRVRKAWAYFLPGCDPYLGVVPGGGADFLVRRLAPWRGEVEVAELRDEPALGAYLDTVALAAARAHARSGKARELLADARGAAALVARIGPFAEAYARQVEADRQVLQATVEP